MKPVIVLTPLIDQNLDDTPWMLRGYFEAIEAAGGIPVMISSLKEEEDIAQVVGRADGILFTGGQDVDPAVYGKEKEVDCDLWISPDRDQLEVPLLLYAMGAGKPVLGICRGLQLINAVLGGTLWQDLPSQHPSDIVHSGKGICHEVSVVPGTPLAALVGKDKLNVNTLHHQAIRDLAPDLRPMAMSPDGLIEAYDKPGADFFWAVQWHPEMIFSEDEPSFKIFQAFVDACRRSA